MSKKPPLELTRSEAKKLRRMLRRWAESDYFNNRYDDVRSRSVVLLVAKWVKWYAEDAEEW